MKDIAIILPTLNEEKTICASLAGIKKAMPDVAVIVADDGSEDGTKKIAACFSGVVFLDRKNEMQKGLCASVLDAMQKYPHRFYIVMDADGQHPPEALPKLAAAMEDGTIAVMAREDDGGFSLFRKFVSFVATILARMRLLPCGRAGVADPMSGFFGIDRETAIEAIGRGRFVKGGFKVLLDFLKIAQAGTKIVQVPYAMESRKGGASKLEVRHVLLLLKSVFS
jgi:dolichol-phosphate mannosyltransferase